MYSVWADTHVYWVMNNHSTSIYIDLHTTCCKSSYLYLICKIYKSVGLLTMFMTVSTYGSISCLPWYPTIILSTTTSVSTCLSVLTERLIRLCWSRHLSLWWYPWYWGFNISLYFHAAWGSHQWGIRLWESEKIELFVLNNVTRIASEVGHDLSEVDCYHSEVGHDLCQVDWYHYVLSIIWSYFNIYEYIHVVHLLRD